MPLNFPDNPTDGQIFTADNRRWIYSLSTNSWSSSNFPVTGATGPIGATGATGFTGATGPSGGGSAADTFEVVSKNLAARDAAFAYNLSGQLSTITYTWDTNSVIKTFNYTDGKLTSIVLSGDTPSGIDLTKTFVYDADAIVQVTYS
jgi:hypothetical protein